MKIQKRALALVLALVMALSSLSVLVACNHDDTCKHQWQDATCTTPKTCKLCSYTEGGLAAHTGGAATCTQKAVCSVCKAEYGETAAHVYENGKCKTCGKDENAGSTDKDNGSTGACDHTRLHDESFDFGKQGACDYVIYYQTCDCGEVKLIDKHRTVFMCRMNEDDVEIEESEDENGNATANMKGVCEFCGMEISAFSVRNEEGCLRKESYTYTFVLNGKTILENIVQIDEYDGHDGDYESINLKEHGCCGGYLEVYSCTKCNEILEIGEIEPTCSIDLDEEPEPEEITDENGIKKTVYKAECPDCSFKITLTVWEEEISVCERITHELTVLSCGDTVIAQVSDETEDDSHEYEYTYVMMDESCDDGYITTAYCDICKITRRYNSWGHDTDRVEVSLTEHGFCENIKVHHCNVCDKDVDISDYGCWWEYKGTGPDGSEIYECMDCGGVKTEHVQIGDKDENCKIISSYRYTYTMNGTEVYKLEYTDKYTDHMYEYSYEMVGETCDDGYTVTVSCADCGETYSYENDGHSTNYREVSLGEKGLCGGYIEEEYCRICNTVTDYYISDYYCNWIYIDKVDGKAEYHCMDCGGTKTVTEIRSETDESCVYLVTESVTYKLNGKEIYSYTKSEYEYDHDYEYTYEMLGETCDDGYIYSYVCKSCGDSDSDSYWGHDAEWSYIYFDEPGMCGGYAEKGVCNICKQTVGTDVYDDCLWMIVEGESPEYTKYACIDCGAVMTESYTYTEKDQSCRYYLTCETVFMYNGKEIFRYTESEYAYDHDYEFIYDNNGNVVEGHCKDCGQEW